MKTLTRAETSFVRAVALLAFFVAELAAPRAFAEPKAPPSTSATKSQTSTIGSAKPSDAEADVGTEVYPPPAARLNLMLGGAAVTAVWYGGALGFSYLWPDAPGANDLRIPVAGPWMALADTGCAKDDPDCSIIIVVLRAALTVIDGVGQAGGVLVMAEGAFLPTQAPTRLGSARPNTRPMPSLTLRPTPIVAGRDGLGLGIAGAF